jgi:hypothetical protein
VNKVSVLAIMLVLFFAVSCKGPDRTTRLADFLKQQKRLRDDIQDSTVLEDSLRKLQKKYSIDIQDEFSRLRKNPQDWPVFLRKLRGG